MGFKILCHVSNLMSSWGSWSKISKLQQVRDFSFCGSKSSLLKHTYQVSFWKSNCWGSWSKISTLQQVGDFLGLKVLFWNTRMWCNFGNRKQHFYGFVKKMVQKNQYTYNVPAGSSNYIYTRGRRPSLMGRTGGRTGGRVDGWTGGRIQKSFSGPPYTHNLFLF